MERRPFTFRIEEDLYAALTSLSSITRLSMNQLVTEAVAVYVKRTTKELERDLERTLEQLRQYSQRDPDFEEAIAQVAEADASLGDPLEGRLIEPSHTTQSEIQELLGDD